MLKTHSICIVSTTSSQLGVTALQNEKLVDKIRDLAKKKGCKPGQLALAWVQHQGDDVFPIPGTKNPKYLEENIAAFDIKLSKEEMTELENAVPRDAVSRLTGLMTQGLGTKVMYLSYSFKSHC